MANMTLTRNGNSITIPVPYYGYVSTVDMPLTIVKLSNGQYSVFDAGATYDVRQCACSLYLNSTEHASFVDFMGDPNKGRGRHDITLTLPSGSGFHPFGPDKNNVGQYTVSISQPDYQGIVDSPYQYFVSEIVMTNQGAYPAYSLPSHTAHAEGSWTIGNIGGLRFPQSLFKPDVGTAYDVQVSRNGTAHIVDRSSGGDWKETSFTLECNHPKIASVVNYLTSTSRSAAFNIITPAGYYPYDYAPGNGTLSSRLIDNILEITHDRYNQFSLNMRIAYII